MGNGIQMGKITKLRHSFFRYLIPCFIVCCLGIIIIEAGSLYLQNWYVDRYLEYYNNSIYAEAVSRPADQWLFHMFYYARIVLIPFWSVCCLLYTAKVFFRRELQEPVDVLTRASERILDADLDFKIECKSQNELGKLCDSFEEMRQNLYDSNYRLWKSLEERKRLNSAFSHDLRTPITVLKGYMDLITQYEGKINPEKQSEILEKMSGQVSRLEHYTEKMSSIQKLEDIIPDVDSLTFGKLCSQLEENGKLLCKDRLFSFSCNGSSEDLIYTDIEIVTQVFMNLISNAQRYAKNCIECAVKAENDIFEITVSDDGHGFSEDALRKAWQPFYRADDENDKEHFGLGLYICWLLCRKAGGTITIQNNKNGGGMVTASFSKNISENQINS